MPVVKAAGRSLNYEWIEGDARAKPTLIFLHEGLGSIRQWRDFPLKAALATGCRALVYDRYGYGESGVLAETRRDVRFMHDEALVALPELRRRLGIEDAILVGHSDGASIALIHAGAGHQARCVVAMAPHVFIEPICIDSIRKAANTFETTDLPARLGRYHRDARKTFYGWADVWLDPRFERWDIRDDYLPGVRCPVAAIQGYDDEYGTMAQLDEIGRRVAGPCELLRLERCGHAPFRDQPERTLAALTGLVNAN
ncbi:MAG TPA: alpha/beta hydrolase [Burkholderiales bacterium]|jgi:pimeloyl-ACP methyl ester carboxylesterase